MIDQVYVIDDVISKGYQDLIERELMHKNAPWHYQKDIALDVDDPAAHIEYKTPGLSHIFYDVDSGGIRSPMMHYLTMPLVLEATAKIGFNLTGLIQSRSFMHFPLAEKLRRPYDNIHVDYGVDHLVCLYYVNDTDGDTYLFDKTFNDVQPGTDFSNVQFNVKQRISPKKGRMVFFNGNQYHSSSCPTLDMRCIINFDLV
jgi:hypothetical protein